jgi:hypothetical protein
LTGIWFIIFVLPMFLFTPDYPAKRPIRAAMREGLSGLKRTLGELPKQKSLATFLLANMIYTDGLVSLFAFGGIYAAGTFGWHTIQIGTYPSAPGGAGSFSIGINTGGSACQDDDGSSENLLGWVAGGDMVWLQSFGSSGGGSTTVSNVQVAWGSPAFPGYGPGNGSPVRVAIWTTRTTTAIRATPCSCKSSTRRSRTSTRTR